MKTNKLNFSVKPLVAMSVIVLAITSITVSALGHKDDDHNHKSKMGYQQGESNEYHRKGKNRLHRLVKKLDLSDEQKAQVKDIFANMSAKHKNDSAGLKEQMQSLMQASEFDENKFEAIHLKRQENFQKMAMKKAKTRHAIMQVLTAEQQEEFLTMGKQRRRSR